MIKKELNGTMNIVIMLLGILLASGIGNGVVMFPIFAAFALMVLLYRGKLYGIPLCAIGVIAYMFLNNYLFSRGVVLGFDLTQIGSTVLIVLNCLCFAGYAIYNGVFIYKKNVNQVKEGKK